MRNTYKMITHFTGEINKHLGLRDTKDNVKRHSGSALELLDLGVFVETNALKLCVKICITVFD